VGSRKINGYIFSSLLQRDAQIDPLDFAQNFVDLVNLQAFTTYNHRVAHGDNLFL
jgi:hypothetical protein